MKIVIVERENGPERLACEAELHLEDGLLSGLKLVGFSVWHTADGGLSVTFPSRGFGVGGERRFFDYLRSVDGGTGNTKPLKDAIVSAVKAR